MRSKLTCALLLLALAAVLVEQGFGFAMQTPAATVGGDLGTLVFLLLLLVGPFAVKIIRS